MKKLMMTSLSRVMISTTIFLWLAFTSWATYLVMNNNTQIYAENGILENLQAFVLFVAFIVFSLNAVVEKKPSKLILLTCSLLCYSFLLRELDVETFNVPYLLQAIGSGTGRNATIAIAFFAILFYALRNFAFYKAAAVNFLKTVPGTLLIMAGLCLIVGGFFEDFYGMTHHVFIEEKLELLAYVLIMLSSFTINTYMKNTTISLTKRT